MLSGYRCPGAVLNDGDGPVLKVMGSQLMNQVFHVAEDSVVVGNGSQNQRLAPECIGDNIGRMGFGHVINGNPLNSPLGQLGGQ